MSKLTLFLFCSLHLGLLLTLTHFSICNGIPAANLSSETNVTMEKVCNRSIGECLTEAAEMDSETSRRVLFMQKRYISYDTLNRDNVPCQRPGASYYNCNGRPANPYRRGCSEITGCARDSDTRN